jgi:hypothetical protein
MKDFTEEERQMMRQQMLGTGMAGQAGAALGAAPMARDAAINAQLGGAMPAVAPTPQELGMAQMMAPQPPSMLQKFARILRGASRSP